MNGVIANIKIPRTITIMEGRMFNFSEDDKNLLAFVSTSQSHVCTNALVLIPGLTDGLMSMAYSPHLARTLQQMDYSLVQVQISSSFMQFGFGSIQKDCKELTELVLFLKDKLGFKKIGLLGHSTGAQDCLYFLRHSTSRDLISAVVLQGAVGDRDYIQSNPELLKMVEKARELNNSGKEQTFLRDYLYNAPITAKRFSSLAERLSDEDMFSVDLTEEELLPILEPVTIPISLCFSSGDEYIPDPSAQRRLADRMVSVLKAGRSSVRVECSYYEGNHGLTEEKMYTPFVKDVASFLKNI